MTTKLVKQTIERVTDADGSVTDLVVGVEAVFMDGDNEIGRITVNQWGGNWYMSAQQDASAIHDRIAAAITGQAVIEPEDKSNILD